MIDFIKRAANAAKTTITSFIERCVKHTEAIAILTLSAVGLNVLLGELPFYWTLPMWIEAPMVIPVLSVLAISGMVKLMQFRVLNRATPATA